MKVLVAIPALDHVPTEFAMSLAALMQYPSRDRKMNKRLDLALSCVQGSLIMDSRNRLVENAKDVGATHILFIDSDMVFPPDTLERLASHHLPIVGCDATRREEGSPLIGTPEVPFYGLPRSNLTPMLMLGFGCILISMRVFTEIELSTPYFIYTQGPTPRQTLSEDMYFCHWARIAGHTIWRDDLLTRSIGHVGTKIFRVG